MRRLVVLTSAALALVACAATSPYMQPARTRAVGPAPADLALVVFLRPTPMARSLVVPIIDASGTFLGESTADSYFVATLERGPHTFIALSEGTHALKAELAPGKTYYVEVVAALGLRNPRFHLMAVKGPDAAARVTRWLAELAPLEVRQAEGQAALVEARRAEVEAAIQRGLARFDSYEPAEVDDRTLAQGDGQ
jgi:hypothetical protein